MYLCYVPIRAKNFDSNDKRVLLKQNLQKNAIAENVVLEGKGELNQLPNKLWCHVQRLKHKRFLILTPEAIPTEQKSSFGEFKNDWTLRRI